MKTADLSDQQLLFALFFRQLQRIIPATERQYVGQANCYIQDVMRYIVANLDKPLTIPAIATEFYISRNKLSHDFKQFTRTTLHPIHCQSARQPRQGTSAQPSPAQHPGNRTAVRV